MEKPQSNWIHELTWRVVEARIKRSDVVLVPIGATEQHGEHAALMLDTGWAIQSSVAAATMTDCLIAPPLHYGWSYGHMAFPGTVGFSAATLTQVAVEIGECLVRHGFKRIVFVNGNRQANVPPLEIAAAKLQLDTGAFVAVADCGLIARDDVFKLAEGPTGTLGHAGESETSMMLAFYPELVDMKLAPPDRPAGVSHPALRQGHLTLDPRLEGNSWFVPRDPAEFYQQTIERGGVVGDAQPATAEKGAQMVRAIGRRIAEGIDAARSKKLTIRIPDIRV
ncbi:creatininase family protein [Pigmentiphaga soli]|uniref:creatininase family protein n=1 Tax=Pigmentiphaga soli TaxID=1007095 RepID=UPI0031E9C972